MTKVRDLTRPIEGEEKKLKPIEFVLTIDHINNTVIKAHRKPETFDFVDRLQKAENNFFKMDLFAASMEGEIKSILYLGHFNDGIVE
jgi:hypothetical protein